MAYPRRVSVTVTTNSSGAGTGYTSIVEGMLLRCQYSKVDYANGVDITITSDNHGQSILAVTDQNSGATWHPRQPTHATDGTASLYAGSGEPVEADIPIASDRFKVVIAQGGDTKSGTFHFWVG